MEGKGKPHGQILRKGQIIAVIISTLCLHHLRLKRILRTWFLFHRE